MNNDRYILDSEGNPQPEPDLFKWAEWTERADRHVAFDDLPGDVQVSTIFLGLDHGFGSAVPVLWETMIFGGEHDLYQERYTSREEALVGHAEAVELAKGTK